MAKKALITGISGQDGSYLADLLLAKGYEVHGLVLSSELQDPAKALWRIKHIMNDVKLHSASIESYPSILSAVEKIQPDECYHLAAQSFVSCSFDQEFSVFNTNVTGTHNILSALKQTSPDCRFYFAASSELFGQVTTFPQNENTPFRPRSAYGITKLTGYFLTCNYRDNYHMFACNGIMYNHESPRRGLEFVSRKITHGAAQIKLGLLNKLHMGNLDAVRDWGFAGDYVKCMWAMLQKDQPGDYVIATGETHSVREMCEIAFSQLGLDYQNHVIVDERFFRPAELTPLVGDASLARHALGWKPNTTFSDLIKSMVDSDYALLRGQEV